MKCAVVALNTAYGLCVFVSLCLCVFVSLCLCVFVSLCLCVFVSLCLCVISSARGAVVVGLFASSVSIRGSCWLRGGLAGLSGWLAFWWFRDAQHGFYAEALRAHLPCLATRAGRGIISCSSGIVRFVQGGVVKTFRCPPRYPMFRAELIADVHEGEHEVLVAWLDTWRARLEYVSANTGCGCCVDCYQVIAPIDALNTLPTNIVNDVFPQRRPFFISFDGDADTNALQSSLNSLADHKRQHGNDLLVVDPPPRQHDFWLGHLQSPTLDRATSLNRAFGRLIDALLCGSYDLLGIREHENVRHLEYAPTVEAFFGGTDPLRDLVALFGFQFVSDSFTDDYDRWCGA